MSVVVFVTDLVSLLVRGGIGPNILTDDEELINPRETEINQKGERCFLDNSMS